MQSGFSTAGGVCCRIPLMKSSLDKDKLLYAASRKEWRAWLRKHYRSAREIWLVYFKKHTGKPRIPYNEAVEEALCFGWIDSTVRSIDEDRFAQRFSVRNPRSSYSQANKERLRNLIRQGKVAKDVLAALGDMGEEEPFQVPQDILELIKANRQAWKKWPGQIPSG